MMPMQMLQQYLSVEIVDDQCMVTDLSSHLDLINHCGEMSDFIQCDTNQICKVPLSSSKPRIFVYHNE